MTRVTMQRQGVSTRVPKDYEYWVYIMVNAKEADEQLAKRIKLEPK